MYTKEEVIRKMDELTLWVIQHADPTKFILNESLGEYDERLSAIQEDCPHEYGLDDYCIYCGQKKS